MKKTLLLCLSTVFNLVASVTHLGAQYQWNRPYFNPAPQLQMVGLPSLAVNQTYRDQKGPMWCWAACLETIYAYSGLSIPQRDIVAATFGTDAFGNPPPFGGATANLITRHLNHTGTDRFGRPFRISAHTFFHAADPAAIIRHLQAGKLIMMAYGPNPHSGHVVLVTAVTFVQTPYGHPQIVDIILRDPMPGYWNSNDKGRRVYRNGTLPGTVFWTWLVDVQTGISVRARH